MNPYGTNDSVSLATVKKELSIDSFPQQIFFFFFFSQKLATRLVSVPTQSLLASPAHPCTMHLAIDT